MKLGRFGTAFLFLLLGALTGFLCTITFAVWAAFHLADWLLVSEEVRPAEVAVVLGGGGGSRLRKGLDLYEQGMVGALVLVDAKASSWDNMLARLCPDCKVGGKPMTILAGSTSTLTDARLVYAHCVEKGIKRILVVTDPYHTRRASLFFNRQFAGSGIEVTTVSSGDYRDRLPPTEEWWRDERTLRVVVMETAKIAAYFLSSLSAQR